MEFMQINEAPVVRKTVLISKAVYIPACFSFLIRVSPVSDPDEKPLSIACSTGFFGSNNPSFFFGAGSNGALCGWKSDFHVFR